MDKDQILKNDEQVQGKDSLNERIFPRQIAEELKKDDLEKVNGGVGGTTSECADCVADVAL